MNRTTVVSSNVVSVGYDASARTLEIEFKGGVVYQYYSVPASIFAGLMNAESVGRYLNQQVKQGGYKYGILGK